MAESKYSLKLAAVDAYSSTFGDFAKKSGALQEGLKLQQAELKQLNQTTRSLNGYVALTQKIEGTTTALAAARVEQAKVSREQAAAAAKVEQLTAQHKLAVDSLKTLGASTEATAAQVRAAGIEEARLSRELGAATSAAAKLDTAQDKATASVKTLQAAHRAESNQLKGLKADLTAAGVDTGKLAGEQKRLEAATEAANSALAAQRAKLAAVKSAQENIQSNRDRRADLRGQMVETAALAYVASRPISQAMDMETAMADVGKVINFEDGGKEAMASANLQLASDRLIASSGMTAIDLAKIEYAAGQSGIGNELKDKNGNIDVKAKTAAVMDFTRDAAIMGSAFDIDAQTAGETMAGWRASMGLDRAQTLDLADSTNYLGNNFNAKAADIAAVVKRYGAVGKASGLTPEQSAALSAALLNPGTEKEIAGTGFKNFTSALVAGKSATKGEKEQWKELGFDPEQLAADMQQNAPDTIMRVLEAIKEQPREEQAAVATNLFGSESIGAIQPLLENLGEVRKAFAMVADKSKYATSVIGEQGSMMQEAAGVANTARTGWNSFTARLTRLSTVVGNAMLPALNAVLVPLGSLVDMVSWAAETFPGVTGALAVAAGGLAALKVGALGLKFVGLLVGQGFNRAGLARAKLDASTGRTAIAADQAVVRLNATLGRLGNAPGGAGSAGGAGGGGGKGKAATTAAKASRFGRLSALGGKVIAPVMAAAGLATVASGALASPTALSTVPLGQAPAAASVAAAAGPAAAKAAPVLTLVPKGAPAAPGAPLTTPRTAPVLSLVPPASAVPGAPGAPIAAARAAPVLSLVPTGSAAPGVSGAPGSAAAAPRALSALRPVAALPAPFLPTAPAGALAGVSRAAPAAAAVAEAAPGTLAKAAAVGGSVLGPMAKVAAKVATPLMLLSGAATAADGLAKGDAGQVGGAVGGMAGGWAGASAGAAIGTAILPGIGTAVGGAIGALAGSGGGEWIGKQLGALVDKLKAPADTAKDVAKAVTENKQITFAPQITMQPTGDPAYDKRLADQIIARLKAEMMAAGVGGDPLAVRRGASLTDGSD
ncbi:phage tail tape measure protein [Pseudomonas entomophila]|uniref:phage tail tape measure protein n=1 Tax=Pseudomonas entomophila TaxID=312306 RepID=UPI0015E3B172|nr:phage tail tape measure protein [Pseudomonas entomophila]MBA1194868.1 phage tail tape measure protein [Pseudomonas entomophila]